VINKDPIVPLIAGPLKSDGNLVESALEEENKWLDATQQLINEVSQSIDEPISWAVFHANVQQQYNIYVTISSHLIPLIPLIPCFQKIRRLWR